MVKEEKSAEHDPLTVGAPDPDGGQGQKGNGTLQDVSEESHCWQISQQERQKLGIHGVSRVTQTPASGCDWHYQGP